MRTIRKWSKEDVSILRAEFKEEIAGNKIISKMMKDFKPYCVLTDTDINLFSISVNKPSLLSSNKSVIGQLEYKLPASSVGSLVGIAWLGAGAVRYGFAPQWRQYN
jgi:hypothetical protein